MADHDKAEQLIRRGFSYMQENVNNQKIYVFVATPELIECLQNDFKKNDYFVDNKLCF